jgi:hypothetical protein
VRGIGLRPKVQVSADGSGVVGHAGALLLADLVDATGLGAAYSTALRSLRPGGTGHDPGRIATDLAVMLADGGEAIADLAVLRDQTGVFGPVAPSPRRPVAPSPWHQRPGDCWPTLTRQPSPRRPRPAPRPGSRLAAVCSLQSAEQGEGIPEVRAAGRIPTGLVLDLDATLVTCHSEKQQAAPTCKGYFAFHPPPCFLANTGEALSGRLWPGTPAPTPQATTPPCPTRHSRRSPTPTGTAHHHRDRH